MLRHFDQQRFHLHAAVVMNDHVRTVLRPLGEHRLERIVQGWKSVSAKLLREEGRRCPVWLTERLSVARL